MSDSGIVNAQGSPVPSLEEVLKYFSIDTAGFEGEILVIRHHCHQDITDPRNWSWESDEVFPYGGFPVLTVFELLMEHAEQCMNPDGTFRNRD